MAWRAFKPLSLVGGKSRRQFCLRTILRARLQTPEPRLGANRSAIAHKNHSKERNNEHVWNTSSSGTGRDSKRK